MQKKVWDDLAPFLQEAGFRITGSSARRFSPSEISVIAFQWFGNTLAKRVGCTPNSFAARLGCYFRCIPSSVSLEVVDGEPQPDEFHCHFRKTLFKTLKQPECDRKDIWYVDTEGRYLNDIIPELRRGLSEEAFPWFQRLSDPREAMKILCRDREDEGKGFGFGADPSPIRHLYRGFIALQAGDKGLAAVDLRKALAAGCFGKLKSDIELALEQTQ